VRPEPRRLAAGGEVGDAVESDELLLVDESHGCIVHRRIVAEQGHADARKTIQGVLIYSYGSCASVTAQLSIQNVRELFGRAAT
jgi:hypothetical protein